MTVPVPVPVPETVPVSSVTEEAVTDVGWWTGQRREAVPERFERMMAESSGMTEQVTGRESSELTVWRMVAR